MGCKKLNITDYFRLTPTTNTQDTHTGVSTGTSETPYSRFKPVIPVSVPNYRYYSPQVGKWLSRDPIGEIGGANLYVFILNEIINKYDILGLLGGGTVDYQYNGETVTMELKAPDPADYPCNKDHLDQEVATIWESTKPISTRQLWVPGVEGAGASPESWLAFIKKQFDKWSFLIGPAAAAGQIASKIADNISSIKYTKTLWEKSTYLRLKVTLLCVCKNDQYYWFEKEIQESNFEKKWSKIDFKEMEEEDLFSIIKDAFTELGLGVKK